MDDPTAPQLEAEGAITVDVTYQGAVYAMPADPDDVDGDVVDAMDDGKGSRALRALLGPEQWARFKATKPKARDYGALIQAWAEAAGAQSPGE